MALLSVSLVTRAAAPAGRYTTASGTVHDNKTGLTWQQAAPAGTYTFGSASTSGTAQNYCATLSLSGGPWRLPTMKELTTIVDYSVASPGPTIDASTFPNTPGAYFWASTPCTCYPGDQWVVDFASGSAIESGGPTSCNVRCVR